MGFIKNPPDKPMTQGEVMAQMERDYKVEVAKDPPLPGANYEEIAEWIRKDESREERKLFRRAPIWRPTPTYNEYAREHMPLAPAYPEMDQEGYVHKQHGNIIIPDYRVYQPERVRKLMPDDVLAKHMTRMEMEGLKDPWLRNDLWKVDPYTGYPKFRHWFKRMYGVSMAIGASLAVFHFAARTIWDKVVDPPAPHTTDEWWKDREIPENQEFKNRIKPKRMLYGLPVSNHPAMYRNEHNGYDWNIEKVPVRHHYNPDNDPNAVETSFKFCG